MGSSSRSLSLLVCSTSFFVVLFVIVTKCILMVVPRIMLYQSIPRSRNHVIYIYIDIHIDVHAFTHTYIYIYSILMYMYTYIPIIHHLNSCVWCVPLISDRSSVRRLWSPTFGTSLHFSEDARTESVSPRRMCCGIRRIVSIWVISYMGVYQMYCWHRWYQYICVYWNISIILCQKWCASNPYMGITINCGLYP